MTAMEDKIVSTILNDKELLDYVERLVAKRLPAGPYLMADLAWYQQVVDLTINQAFEDLQVVETLNYQISQLGEYLKKKTEDKSDLKRNNGEITTDIDFGEGRIIDHPSFSSSEPVQRSRRPRKDSSKKLNNQHITNGDLTNTTQKRQANKLQQQHDKSQGPRDFFREDAEVHAELQNTHNPANTCITDDELSLYHSRNDDLNDREEKNITRDANRNRNRGTEVFHYVDEPIKPSMSYSNQLNNLQQNLNYDKETDDIHSSNISKKTFLHVDNAYNLKNSGNDLPSRSNTSRYSHMQPSSVTQSTESYRADLPVHLEERILSRTAEKTQGYGFIMIFSIASDYFDKDFFMFLFQFIPLFVFSKNFHLVSILHCILHRSQSLMSTTGGFLIHKEINKKNDVKNIPNGKIFASTTPLQRSDEENYGLRTFHESSHNQYEIKNYTEFEGNEEICGTNEGDFNVNYQIPENDEQSIDAVSINNNYSNIFESSITESQADTIIMGNDYGIASDSENEIDEKYYDENTDVKKMGEYDMNEVEIELKLEKNVVSDPRIISKDDKKDNNCNSRSVTFQQRDEVEGDDEGAAEAEAEVEEEEIEEENQVEDDDNVEAEEDEIYAADGYQEENDYDDEEFNSVDNDDKINFSQARSPQKLAKSENEIKNNNNDSLTEKINNIEKNKNPDIYSSWSLPSDNIRRVQFATKIISDTYTIREKHSLFEIPTLFYTHDESIQFTRDYNRCVLLLRKLIIFYHIFFFHRFFYFSHSLTLSLSLSLSLSICLSSRLTLYLLFLISSTSLSVHLFLCLSLLPERKKMRKMYSVT